MVIEFKLKEIREEKGLSLRELEKLALVSKSEISDIERNLKMPRICVMCKLALALGVTLEELVKYHK